MNTTSLTSGDLRRRVVLTGLATALGLTTVVVTHTRASAESPVGPTRSQLSSGVTDERVFIKTHPRESSRVTTSLPRS